MPKLKKYTVKQLEKKLWTVFSKYIRLRDCKLTTDSMNYGLCITCQARVAINECDAGHFVKATHKIHKFDERNVNLQCKRCNLYLNGNEGKYAVELAKKYSFETVCELQNSREQLKKYTTWELEELIERYKQKYKELGGI